MKKLVITLVVLLSMQLSNAQITTPKASPIAEIEQVVGLTKVEVDYARPAKKGRSVFGDLVPYGRLWRTGANENTKIEFSDNVEINGVLLPKGEYALYTIPSPNQWEVIFYKTTDNWGLPKDFNEEAVVLRTTAKVGNTSSDVEYFTIAVNPIDDSNGELLLSWEKTLVTLPFKVPTHQKAMESIKSLSDQSKPSDFYAAGQYLFTSGADNKLALDYVNKAIALQKDAPFYMLRVKSLIQAKLGDKKGAIATAQESLKKAQEAKNDDYVKMNKDSILEWSK
jgi:hypothetical protein